MKLFPVFSLVFVPFVSLVSCMPTASSSYEVHDLLLYGQLGAASERQVFFYGQSDSSQFADVTFGQDVLKLKTATDVPQAASTAIVFPSSLSVNNQSSLKLSAKNIAERFNLAKVPLSNDLSLLTKESVESVLYFDGRNWFDVAGPTNSAQKLRLIANKRDGLNGLGQLTNSEAAALANYLKPQGEMALALLPKETIADAALSLDPAPLVYRRTALVIQHGVPTDVLAALSGRATVPTKVLAESVNSGYEKAESTLLIDRDRAGLERTWAVVGALQLPAPSAPQVDFAKYKVVTFFLGQKSSGGYSVSFASAKITSGKLTLALKLSQPKPGNLTTQALTSPYVSVLVGTDFKTAEAVDAATGKVLSSAK